MIAEIKRVALVHLERDGSALSLRGVARDMKMVSSAIYRYFPSRDELLTALIIDAYTSLADAADAADGNVDRREAYLARWFSVGHTIRNWALAHPAEYALIYGSPIPGYKAPMDTVPPAARTLIALGRCIAEAEAAGKIREPEAPIAMPPTENAEYAAELRAAAEALGFVEGSQAIEPFLSAATHVYGAVNFEVFGRLNNAIDQRNEWFDRQLRQLAAMVGITPR
ncbi:TetR-like C-terminal domain-containing protein [Catenulispora yoronensis]